MPSFAIDLEAIRADTPGVANCIHLNNAGAALMPRTVVDAMIAHINLEAQTGGYEAASLQAEGVANVYASVARLIGAAADEVALLENATLAWNMAFYGLRFRQGDRILTSQSEYGANFVAFLRTAERTGAKIEIAPSDDDGAIDPDALASMVDETVKLIAVSHMPTNGGLINPVEAIGRVARKNRIPFLLDACQTVGQMPIDVAAIGCDALSATGRKFLRGPRGTGFLYVRRGFMDTIEPPMPDHFAAKWLAADRYELRGDARRFETWENNYAAILGLGAAVDYAIAIGLEPIRDRAFALADRLRAGLRSLDGVTIYDLGARPGAIVTWAADGVESAAIKASLAEQRINISVSQPTSTMIDATTRALPPLVRMSPHYYNTEDEIDRTLDATAAALGRR
ncbi:MAG: aminotransferase class V-fold PLP-dependent enzyme [Alphaproteobacteria bacterium]|nr:aminotransferase class V-fold PLP-dependent enzyme [Alphaproteobacteria bacterium]